MRRLIMLLFAAAAATAAARAVARKRGTGSGEELGPSVMPRPTATPAAEAPPAAPETREEPVHETTEPPGNESETRGPIDEGEPGAITAAPVPEEPVPEPPPTPDDSELERAVETEIAEDPAVQAAEVEVDVEGGVAQLRGSVPDEQTALRVGDDAARVEGVIGLDDQLDRQAETAEPESSTPPEGKGDEDE